MIPDKEITIGMTLSTDSPELLGSFLRIAVVRGLGKRMRVGDCIMTVLKDCKPAQLLSAECGQIEVLINVFRELSKQIQVI